ncbi:MAG: hypothetical protein ACRCXA_05270, partial [Peptostreptococcaceae bacterium]
EGGTDTVFNDEDLILNAGLELPWLVKIHKNLGLPLFKTEEELYAYWHKSDERCETLMSPQPILI